MKRHNIYSIIACVVAFVVVVMVLLGCNKLDGQTDDCIMQMDSAALDMHDMDFASAKLRLRHVLKHSSNKLHRASADIMMMRVSTLLAENKEFYDFRVDAQKCMKVLREDEQYMGERRLLIWHYVQSAFYRESASYFQLMRQETLKQEMIDTLSLHPEWNDADSLHLDSNLIPKDMKESLRLVLVSDMLAAQGDFTSALDSLSLVLHKINVHHLKYHPSVSADDTLTLTGLVSDSMSREMQWIHNPNIVAIPQWMAALREQLSLVYGAMGDKESSNYNRNIYFDILDATRQDMQMQQRHESLKSEGGKLNLYIILFIAFALFAVLTTSVATRKISLSSRQKREKLSKCLDICGRMVNGEDIDGDVIALLPDISGDWKEPSQIINKVKPFERELLSLLQVFNAWIRRNTELYEMHIEQKETVEEEIYKQQLRTEENKRRHIDRATAISIVQGITPFLDRAIHQIEKGEEYVDRELLREYILKINAYNDVLGHWVKVRQGSVTLNIENFSLVPLLDTLRKGHRTFESKKITLHVDEIDAIVKADKALTLFMMNTLLDNARKYTPEGGEVSLTIDKTDEYVEVSVQDSGCGLSPEDLDKINNSKVYDSSQIGVENDTEGTIRKNKGFGFGLQNCRGIIEKYRKSGKVFEVCQFGAESTMGKGSRFFFRLPKGVMRTLIMIFAFVLNIDMFAQRAENYLDSLYECNVRGDYEEAVAYADSAIVVLNEEYCSMSGRTEPLMQLVDDKTSYAELQWFADGVDMDYTLIIQIRNEISLAAISLANRPLYNYNNEAFLQLNKQTSQDPNIEEDCRKIAKANAGKNLVLILGGLILVATLVLYLLIYYHQTVLPVFNMRQLAEFLKRMFTAEESQMPRLLHEGVSLIRPADAVMVQLANGSEYMHGEVECKESIPLVVDFEGETHDLGSMYIAYHGSKPPRDAQLTIEFVAKFAAIHTFFESVKVEEQQNTIELLEDQRLAAEVEQQRLHVQNMVLDNCLSTIKHETMYYPNRILQLLDNSGESNVGEMSDVIHYYREVFGLLSENANRQLSRSIVKLQNVSLTSLANYAMKNFERQNRKHNMPVEFSITGERNASVKSDIILLQYLLDTLLTTVFEYKTKGKVVLNFEKSEGFIKFALSDTRINRTEEENSVLFYADSMRYDAQNDFLLGAQYLIAKQIIREHDERLGHPGCRIYAEGDRVVFTLPLVNSFSTTLCDNITHNL